MVPGRECDASKGHIDVAHVCFLPIGFGLPARMPAVHQYDDRGCPKRCMQFDEAVVIGDERDVPDITVSQQACIPLTLWRRLGFDTYLLRSELKLRIYSSRGMQRRY